MKWFRRLQTRRASPSWNKAFGIDPQVVVSDEDMAAVEHALWGSWMEESRHRGSTITPPLWVVIIPSLPGILTFIAGIVAVEYWGAPVWAMPLFFLAALILLFVCWSWMVRWYFGPLCRRELRARGYEICVDCGYWLRGLGDGIQNCPECGKPVTS